MFKEGVSKFNHTLQILLLLPFWSSLCRQWKHLCKSLLHTCNMLQHSSDESKETKTHSLQLNDVKNVFFTKWIRTCDLSIGSYSLSVKFRSSEDKCFNFYDEFYVLALSDWNLFLCGCWRSIERDLAINSTPVCEAVREKQIILWQSD